MVTILTMKVMKVGKNITNKKKTFKNKSNIDNLAHHKRCVTSKKRRFALLILLSMINYVNLCASMFFAAYFKINKNK